ncbi:NAD(P)H-hydrate dehydratase [Orbaceae bacterium ESL0727]|nr:NAD(P)H-hydrate dehydratase [Orbaceae bacterium ESL0727]
MQDDPVTNDTRINRIKTGSIKADYRQIDDISIANRTVNNTREYLISVAEMQRYDAQTIHQVGLPALLLMERAALSVMEQLKLNKFKLDNVAVVCGYGNNGGDGVAIARLLKLQQIAVTLYMIGNGEHLSPETKQQLKIADYYNLSIHTQLPDSFAHYTTVIDAIFGIGLNRMVSGIFADAIHLINQSQVAVLAVDIPSGIDADTGKKWGVAIKATQTVTFAYPKLGLILYPGADLTGKITVADIGIYADILPIHYSYSFSALKRLLPVRANYSNKGSFGRVLVIAGSQTMSGAAYFSAKAAYRTGAGLVRIYTPECNRTLLLSQLPEGLLTTYDPNQVDEAQLRETIQWASVIVIGPGMGLSATTKQILTAVLTERLVPVIIDADGLNVLAEDMSMLSNATRQASSQHQPIIVTPHLGEMARLTHRSIAEISDHLLSCAKQFASQYRVICVLKDTRTIVAAADEEAIYINQSGNNGMATGGAGDVLTGIIAGLIAQHLPVLTSVTTAVYLHGLAGDAAAQKRTAYSVIADDIIDGISDVLLTL